MKTLLSLGLCLAVTAAAAEPIPPERLTLMIEALTRLSPEQVNDNPRLQTALGKVLDATRGTAQFVKLVQQFKATNQNAGLVEFAVQNPADESGVAALKLVLAAQDTTLLQTALAGTNAVRAVEALGNARDRQTIPLLLPLVTDAKRDAATRKAAVRALVQVQEGAAELLRLAREDRLGAEVKFVASTELNNVRWPQLKAEAAKVLPLPQGQGARALPPVAELLKMAGDAKRGAEIYRRDAVGCIKCHQVNGEGTDFGPALSEIGSKLGKDALLEAILDPSAGISMGYEAWTIELKNGDEAFGLLVSDAAEEVALKAVGGVVTRYKKGDIARRTQGKLSIMPAGLQQAMTTQELVDLVEYLASLKKK